MSRADELREKMRKGRTSILSPAPTPSADQPIMVGDSTSLSGDGKIVMTLPPTNPKQVIGVNAKQPKKQKQKKNDDAKFAKFRLPHGTAFVATYDGPTETWKVSMVVPSPSLDAPNQIEEASSTSVNGVIMRLGRKWAQDNGVIPKEEAVTP